MADLLNEWMKLFDENCFHNLNEEPQDLRAITMLYVIIQKEFKKVENALSEKLQTFQLFMKGKSSKIKQLDDEIITVTSSPEKNTKSPVSKLSKNNSSGKSPTLERHRKLNLKKARKHIDFPNVSGIFPLKNEFSTPKNKIDSSKVILNASDDEDMFDSTIIGVTPNVEISKKTRNNTNCQRKKAHSKTSSASRSKTLTQLCSRMMSKDDKKDETTMMDIDEILETVEKAEKNERTTLKSSENTSNPVLKNIKISDSFIDDYDKIPQPKTEPTTAFAYKETVRGNEKKKLKGWACKECERFYKGMKLSDEELEKKMNECSKHKSKFKPDEETIAGYWDLSIPSTPEDEKSTPPDSPEETQTNLDESTVFCFYKK